MKRYEVTLYTNVMFLHEGETAQQNFTVTIQTEKSTFEAAAEIVESIKNHKFLSNDKGTHFYLASTITDFSIVEVANAETVAQLEKELQPKGGNLQ